MRTLQPNICIDKESVNELPIESFGGAIHVVDTPEAAETAIETLRHAPMLGIDTETKPSFRKGKTNKVSLIQIATDNECFLFRINKIGFTPALRDLLTDPDLLKIGLSLKDDFSVLHRVGDFKPQNYVELQTLVKQYGIADMSLQKIYAIIFGKKYQRLNGSPIGRLPPSPCPNNTMPHSMRGPACTYTTHCYIKNPFISIPLLLPMIAKGKTPTLKTYNNETSKEICLYSCHVVDIPYRHGFHGT